jgi:hypothetical protein
MGRKKKHSLPFDTRGGVIVTPLRLIKSPIYQNLIPQAKVLMMLLQIHWRNDKPVDYGIREAAEKIPCSEKTASKAFNQLQERGFITCMEQSFFSSRTQSKSRGWRLEWLPYKDRPPANTWETGLMKINATVGNTTALAMP